MKELQSLAFDPPFVIFEGQKFVFCAYGLLAGVYPEETFAALPNDDFKELLVKNGNGLQAEIEEVESENKWFFHTYEYSHYGHYLEEIYCQAEDAARQACSHLPAHLQKIYLVLTMKLFSYSEAYEANFKDADVYDDIEAAL